jgi:hypothetical protein
MPALLSPPVGGPGDDVRGGGQDLVVAAGAAVGLGRGRSGDGADVPVTVGMLFEHVHTGRDRLARRAATTHVYS